MKNRTIIEGLATWGYLGKSPYAPGTVGTVGAIPVVVGMFFLPPILYLVMAFVLTLLAIWISSAHERNLGVHDSREIVIDEVVGYVIAMTWLPHTWQSLLAAFLLFRFLDALKPYPISVLDRKIEGGFGVVMDDVAAGLVTNIALQYVYTNTDWLGIQLAL